MDDIEAPHVSFVTLSSSFHEFCHERLLRLYFKKQFAFLPLFQRN